MPNRDKSITIRIDSPNMENVERVMQLWREKNGEGPQPSPAQAVRHLLSISAESERKRLENC